MNNKFKRFNKILMMTVAILLCLVLISTSVVSGIFAKYVITKSAGATVSLKKFGVTLTLTKGSGITATETKVGDDVISVTVSSLELEPNQSIDEVVKFAIGGTPNVAGVNLKITTTVSGLANYTAPKGIGGVTATNGTKYLPIATTATVKTSSEAATTTTLYDAWQSPASASAIQTGIVSRLRTAIGDTATESTNVATKKICTKVGDTPTITYISFGFAWPDKAATSSLNFDEIGTYLASIGVKFTVTYSVSLEQVLTTT